jgi:protein-disulfide isomerase
VPAAEAAVEAKTQGGDVKFWKMHEIMFKNQQKLGGGAVLYFFTF